MKKNNYHQPLKKHIFEQPIVNAPTVKLSNGEDCIPQHYFRYQHTISSVQDIVLAIDYSPRYPIFVCQQDNTIYIQVGIIGIDNYQPSNKSDNFSQQKIVYGRKWRVETELPTSELIQTTFLAIKKAREHEIRELFRLTYKGAKTTPFNNHHDLPLMSEHPELFLLAEDNKEEVDEQVSDISIVKQWISYVEYEHCTFSLEGIEQRKNGHWLIDIRINSHVSSNLPETIDNDITLHLPLLSLNVFYFHLMQALIMLSDRHVDENFSYNGFKRFSYKNSILAVAGVSSLTRNNTDEHEYANNFNELTTDTDKLRVPTLDDSALSSKIVNTISQFGRLSGMPPINIKNGYATLTK